MRLSAAAYAVVTAAVVLTVHSTIVITPVNFFTDDRDVALGCIKWIGLPGKADGWDLDFRFHLASGASARKTKMFGGILVLRGFPVRFPNHLEAHSRRSGYRVQRGPARLIDHRNVFHFKCESASVWTDVETAFRHRNDPVESGWRNGRVKIVDLIRGDSLSPEQRESYVGESSVLRCARGPVIAKHDAVVSCRAAECDSISLVVGTHAGKGAATRYFSFEVVNVRRFQIRTRRLIVTPIFVEPWNWVWIAAAVRGHGLLVRDDINE